MFDKLKKKSIEIICPACKGGQTEPSLAFSTYCRTCGVHLKIIKGIARLNSGPRLSGISTVRIVSESVPSLSETTDDNEPKKTAAASDTWVKSNDRPKKAKERKRGKRKKSRNGATPKKPEKPVLETTETQTEPESFADAKPMASVAEVFGLTQAPNIEETEPAPNFPKEEDYQLGEHAITLGQDAAPFDKLTKGSMGAMISDLVEQEEKRHQAKASNTLPPTAPVEKVEPEEDAPQTPEPGILMEPEKPVITKKDVPKNKIKVRCFRCNHRQWEAKHAESTQCGRCNTYISLADYHIRQATDRVIRTRGNVTVHRKGSLLGEELACRDLLAMGTISTKIDCSGEARFKYSASVNGQLYCESLIIEKGTIVEFSEGVYSESVKIYGTLRGDVTCAGVVEVARTGILDGDVTAQVINLQDGGTLTGEMIVDQSLKMKLPEVKGYDPSIID